MGAGMAVGQYRPGRLSTPEVEAVDGHRHLTVDAWAEPPTDRPFPQNRGSAALLSERDASFDR
jgi:hypothetical protein